MILLVPQALTSIRPAHIRVEPRVLVRMYKLPMKWNRKILDCPKIRFREETYVACMWQDLKVIKRLWAPKWKKKIGWVVFWPRAIFSPPTTSWSIWSSSAALKMMVCVQALDHVVKMLPIWCSMTSMVHHRLSTMGEISGRRLLMLPALVTQ